MRIDPDREDDRYRIEQPVPPAEPQEVWLRDALLDNALEETFPASDPIAPGIVD